MPLTQIKSLAIKDGEIVNADVNASAAIAGTKISPDFGSQNINTTATVTSGNAVLSSTFPNLSFTDSDHNSDFRLEVNSGQFKIKDTTNSANRLIVQSDGTIDVTGNLDVGAGIDCTGAITGTTTISDSKGNVRSIPLNSQSSAYTLVAADAGKVVYISSGGVTINENVFSAGDAVTIINNSGSNQTLSEGSGSMVLYNTADGTTGNRTLAGRGMCTLYWATTSNAYISGAGLT